MLNKKLLHAGDEAIFAAITKVAKKGWLEADFFIDYEVVKGHADHVTGKTYGDIYELCYQILLFRKIHSAKIDDIFLQHKHIRDKLLAKIPKA